MHISGEWQDDGGIGRGLDGSSKINYEVSEKEKFSKIGCLYHRSLTKIAKIGPGGAKRNRALFRHF